MMRAVSLDLQSPFCVRDLNVFADRSYERLTSPLNSSWSSLTLADILKTECFHFFETPDVFTHNVYNIMDQRHECALDDRPLIIWEPQAKAMRENSLQQHLNTAILCDVFSPNHIELGQFFDQVVPLDFDRARIERQASRFVQDGLRSLDHGCVVVRCAQYGCLVVARHIPATWLPAYSEVCSLKVVNSTGGGNAFLGGFSIGYQETGCFIEAAKYGSVAASFVIEQVGLPVLFTNGVGELWNGDSVRERLGSYERALSGWSPDSPHAKSLDRGAR